MGKDINAIVQTFTDRVMKALNSNNVAGNIQKAVWEMLKELDIPTNPVKKMDVAGE